LTEALAFPGQRKTAMRAAKAAAKPRVIIPITAATSFAFFPSVVEQDNV